MGLLGGPADKRRQSDHLLITIRKFKDFMECMRPGKDGAILILNFSSLLPLNGQKAASKSNLGKAVRQSTLEASEFLPQSF